MANRQKGYGLSAEVKSRLNSKYSKELAKEALDWIQSLVPELDLECSYEEDAVHAKLKDGQVLCKLINALAPGSVAKINTNSMAFKQMENIGNFLSATEKFGVAPNDSFQTVDLYERQNIPGVISTIHALGRKANSKGLPGIGPKESAKNVRTFTDEQLKAGKNVIGLQMGSNKGASQAGQNFGKTRAIID